MTDSSSGPTTNSSLSAVETPPSGIGGWLILPLLGMFAALCLGLLTFREVGSNLQLASSLTPVQALLLYVEVVAQFILNIIAPTVLLVAFFRRSRRFPSWFITWLLLAAGYNLLDLLFTWNAFRAYLVSTGTGLDQETVKVAIRSVVAAVIWVPYMMNSVRVKNTFVN